MADVLEGLASQTNGCERIPCDFDDGSTDRQIIRAEVNEAKITASELRDLGLEYAAKLVAGRLNG